jgi:histidinol-phosphate aminotransferase
VKLVPLTSSYAFDPEALVGAIDSNTRMVYIANPNNPTGTYLNKEQFEWLMATIPDHILVVMDKAYYEFAHYEKDYPDTLATERENLIVLRTFSKGYGLAGLRIGYAIGSEQVIGYMNKTKLTFEPGALAQSAALAAWRDNDFLQKSYKMVEEGRKDMYRFLEEAGITYVPSAANFVMAVFESPSAAETFTKEMLKKGVILRWLKAFGLEHCVRITIGTVDERNHCRKAYKAISLA